MYKYKIYFNQNGNDKTHVLEQIEKHVPTWNALSISDVEDNPKYDTCIFVVSSLAYDLMDRKLLESSVEVLNYILATFGLNNFEVISDNDYTNYF